MSDQYLRDRYNTYGSVENAGQETNSPVGVPDPKVEKVSAGPVIVQEMPMGGAAAPVGSMDGATSNGVSVFDMPTQEIPVSEKPAAVNAIPAAVLLTQAESGHFRTRWNAIQGKFVDEPREAVQQADALVTEVITHITELFAREHGTLEKQWNQGSDVSTEDLRKALQQYRAFFNRLVV